MITVFVNGQKRSLDAPTRISDLVDSMLGKKDSGEQTQGVAAALNGRVVPRGQWDQTLVQDGDRIEVVRAVQGG